MKIKEKSKYQIKVLSILLTLVMLLANVFGIAASADSLAYSDELLIPFMPSDPLEFMQDIPVESHRIPDDLWEYHYNLEER